MVNKESLFIITPAETVLGGTLVYFLDGTLVLVLSSTFVIYGPSRPISRVIGPLASFEKMRVDINYMELVS
jgi:hypothetical protein